MLQQKKRKIYPKKCQEFRHGRFVQHRELLQKFNA
jgi:hypothetical protein